MHILPVFFALALAPLRAEGPEVRTTAKDRIALSVTIYQNSLAAIRDTRRVSLPEGPSRLAFADLVPTLRPKSATLLDPGYGIQVRERNYEFNLLSPASLVDASLELPVRIKGEEGRPDLDGTLASLPLLNPRMRVDAKPLERIARLSRAYAQHPDPDVLVALPEGLRSSSPAGLAFTQVPPQLRASPTLLQDLIVEKSDPRDLTLLYTATGFEWTPHYVATISTDGKRMDLDVFATVKNEGSLSLENCSLQLIAGWVDWMPDPPESAGISDKTATVEVVASSAAGPPVFQEEKLFEFPLFSLNHPVTLHSNSDKQLILFGAQKIPLIQRFLVECPYDDYTQTTPATYLASLRSQSGQGWEERRFSHVQRVGKFQNTKESNLGRALPGGSLTLRYQDPMGALVILPRPENYGWEFPEAAPGEEIELILGRARGFRVFRRDTYQKLKQAESIKDDSGKWRPQRRWEYEIEIRIASDLSEAAGIIVREPLMSDWRVLSTTHKGNRSGENAFDFAVSIPAKGQALLRYTVVTSNEPVPNSN